MIILQIVMNFLFFMHPLFNSLNSCVTSGLSYARSILVYVVNDVKKIAFRLS